MLTGPLLSTAHSGEIKILVKDCKCIEEGKIVVHYGIISTFGFDYNNVTLGFKITEEGKTVACKKMKIVVLKGSDGTEINELIFNVPCSGKSYTLQATAFYDVKQYKIDKWFSDCD